MLQRCLILILVGLTTLTAQAAPFDFLPATSGPVADFRSAMNSGNFKKALGLWAQAHGSTSFGRSQTGQATLAYLLYQNGLQVSGLEHLFNATQSRHVNADLLKIWSVELTNSAAAQKGLVASTRGWSSVIDNSPASVALKNKRDIERAFARAAALPSSHMNPKARIWFKIATLAPQIGQIDSSLKALKLLSESGQTVIGHDLIDSTYGRVLYQKGDLDASLEAFHRVPKSSNLWIESVEERAWLHLRRFDLDKALGETVTLLSPALVPLVGPESYYLTNLLSLKACDFPRIFKTSELFKKRHTERLGAMQELAKTGTNKNLNGVFERFDKGGVSVETAGPLAEWIPRAAYRDSQIARALELRRLLLGEIKQAGKLGGLVQIASGAAARADRLKIEATKRLRVLAAAEVREYRQMLDKMHIVEGEVIHRLAVDDNLKGQRGKLAKVEDQGEVLVFPYTNDEVWFDELDNYKARVKDCPTLKGASL